MHDVQNIWHVPLVLESQGAHESICKALDLGGAETMNLGFWRQGLAERWDNLAAVVWHSPLGSCNASNLSVFKAEGQTNYMQCFLANITDQAQR